MRNRLFIGALIAALTALGIPQTVDAARAKLQAQAGQISGTATDQAGKPVANATVRLRNADTGELAGTTTASAGGAFSFAGLNPGKYIVEILDAAGAIIGTSVAIGVTAGAVVTGVAVTTTAAGAIAGAAAGAAAAGGFWTSAVGITVVTAAVAGGVTAAVVAARGDASPAR